jgi:MoxR-like ATPase
MDRFLMRISLGYPDRAAERALLAGQDRRDLVEHLPSLLDGAGLQHLQQLVLAVHAADPLLDYVQDLIAATRNGQWFVQGLSPRAGIAVLRAAKAQALLSGRNYVAPDDVQAILPQTIAHRLIPVGDSGRGAVEQQAMCGAMLAAVPPLSAAGPPRNGSPPKRLRRLPLKGAHPVARQSRFHGALWF